jgi:diguanylate cyclase (GGDEF)-like protein
VLEAFDHGGAALCLADENDDIRHASASYRKAFCPHYDGARSNFMSVIAAAIRTGTGIKLVSQPLDDFASYISERRRKQVGSYSFAADTVDGRWWWVTDTKLANGWMLCVAQDITALKREEFRLRDAHASALEEAQTDHLTGIANRRHGLRRAEELFTAARASGDALSIALFDLDHFKGINDRHGHEVGDWALVHLARHIQLATNAGDRFSRLGGDEFLLVANADSDGLGRCLMEALEELPPLDLRDGGRLRLSVSIGVAQALTPDDAWPDLMRRADRALYEAKASGRCRIACAA